MDNENITQEVMEQYEQLRQLGLTNMFDINGVCNYAMLLGFDDLAEFAENRNDYMDLLMNFSHYMDEFGIIQ